MQTGARPASHAPGHGAPHALRLRAGAFAGLEVRLERRLAAGRMTEVWFGAADDERRLAVKVLKSDWLPRPGARALLRREYEVLGSLQHPGIVAVGAFVDEPDCAALVYEYLGGGDLVSLAGAAPRHWIAPARDLLCALEYLHGRDFAHRDVKARNVMFDSRGRARLIDFGSAARIGEPCSEHGTTAAHRPLHARLTRVAPQLDLYAFAVLLYELLSGRLPFGVAPGASALRGAPELPASVELEDSQELAALQKLVLAALAPSDDRSIGSVSEFANVIESVLAKESRRQ